MEPLRDIKYILRENKIDFAFHTLQNLSFDR